MCCQQCRVALCKQYCQQCCAALCWQYRLHSAARHCKQYCQQCRVALCKQYGQQCRAYCTVNNIVNNVVRSMHGSMQVPSSCSNEQHRCWNNDEQHCLSNNFVQSWHSRIVTALVILGLHATRDIVPSPPPPEISLSPCYPLLKPYIEMFCEFDLEMGVNVLFAQWIISHMFAITSSTLNICQTFIMSSIK